VKARLTAVRPALAPLTAVVAIALSALLWHHLPVPTDIYAPFDVRADTGSKAVGRGLTTTVTGVDIAPRITKDAPNRMVQAIGVWVIVDTTMAATVASALPRAELLIGPNTYSPTTRLVPATLGLPLNPGIVQTGAWVFDVPPSLLDTVGSIVLRTWVDIDPRLDSRLAVTVDLRDPRVTRNDGTAVVPRVVESGVAESGS
jgi:hypothetical protein